MKIKFYLKMVHKFMAMVNVSCPMFIHNNTPQAIKKTRKHLKIFSNFLKVPPTTAY